MINIGIIGCGHWGPNFIRNFSEIEGTYVKYVCDLHKHRLSHIKTLFPGLSTTHDYLKILKDKDIEAVVIATPSFTHYKLAKKALSYNKHILVEKPIALNIKEAKELTDMAKDKKRVLLVGHTFMYNPAINKIREIIKKGKLGKIYYLHSKRTNLGPLRQDVSAMWDLAPHDISIFSYLLDAKPIEVIAKGQDYLQKSKEDVAFITLTYPKRIIANIHVSWLDPRKVRETTIVGTRKMLLFDDLHQKEPIKIYDKRVMKKKYKYDYDTFREFQMIIKDGEKLEAPKIKPEEPLKIECRHFLRCIHSGLSPLTGGENGCEVVKVLQAVQKSLKENGSVKLS